MIYVFLAEGFEEIEALAVVDILRRAELDVLTVGVGGKSVKGAHGINVEADITQKEVTTDNMTAAVLPGGMPGTLNLEKSPIVLSSIDYCIESGQYVCAICAAPSILGHAGILEGKKAVCFPGFEAQLKGADVTDSFVEEDGKLITAKGPGCAIEFGLKIAEKFVGRAKADAIRMSLQCP